MKQQEGMGGPLDEEECVELTSDDEAARRIAGLYLRFANSSGPISSEALLKDFYPGESQESARRKFRRDKQLLVRCGLVIENVGGRGAEGLWQADPSRSWAQVGLLSAEEARIIDILCLPFASDPAFPARTDLRSALLKIDRAFSGEAALVPAPRQAAGGSRTDKVLSVLSRCLVLHHRVLAEYTDAAGATSKKVLRPYGTFGMRGHAYFVCAEERAEGSAAGQALLTPRTYRDDRFLKAREITTGPSFEIPEDFSLDEYRRLPFQMGTPCCDVEFFVPDGCLSTIEPLARRQGTLSATPELRQGCRGRIWTVPAADPACAGAWAIGQGIIPLSPDESVGSWRKTLEEASRHGA